MILSEERHQTFAPNNIILHLFLLFLTFLRHSRHGISVAVAICASAVDESHSVVLCDFSHELLFDPWSEWLLYMVSA